VVVVVMVVVEVVMLLKFNLPRPFGPTTMMRLSVEGT
jgi:hypothetical protein